MIRRVRVVCVSICCIAAPAAAGPDAIEGLVDAGELISTAMNTTVLFPGQPTSLSGRLEGIDGSPADFVDAYLITITTPGSFRAETFQAPPLPGRTAFASDFNTQLWLFDASGMGLLANDDKAVADVSSLLTPPSTDGTGVTLPGPGTYLLAISVSGVSPLSAGGSIFDLTDPPGITQVSGPDGLGGGSALIGWDTSSPGAMTPGDYVICITPAPSTLSALLLACALRRRRG